MGHSEAILNHPFEEIEPIIAEFESTLPARIRSVRTLPSWQRQPSQGFIVVQFMHEKLGSLGTIRLTRLPARRASLIVKDPWAHGKDPTLWRRRAAANGLQQRLIKHLQHHHISTEGADRKTIGRPGLSPDELTYTLEMARRAEEIKAKHPEKTWKEILVEIGSRYGSGRAAQAKLRRARKKLAEQRKNPAGSLDERMQV